MLTRKMKDDLLMLGLWLFAMTGVVFLVMYCIHGKFYLGALFGSSVLLLGVSVLIEQLKDYFFKDSSKETLDEIKPEKKEKEKSTVA